MTSTADWARRLGLVLTFASGMAVAGSASAQDWGGTLNLFGARSEPARPQPSAATSYAPQPYYAAPRYRSTRSRTTWRAAARARADERDRLAERYEQSYRSRRSARSGDEPRSRYAALPKPGEDSLDKLAQSKRNIQPVDKAAIARDPTAALLRDPTLRSGDIVVMRDGPKVFTGSTGRKRAGGVRHRLRDFADVKDAGVVDKKTRQLLLAMMAPVGALPAAQARKFLVKMRKIAPDDEIEPVVTASRASNPRVIVPWESSGLPKPDRKPAPKDHVVSVNLVSSPKDVSQGKQPRQPKR